MNSNNGYHQFDDVGPIYDEYDHYAALYDPGYAELLPRRMRGRASAAKQGKADAVAALTDEAEGLEAGFQITYKPARYERQWLLSSLTMFYAEALITDVLAQVKGGKEASVYRCTANESTGEQLLAAKVYRPRQFRNLRNDKVYREGRNLIAIDGRAARKHDQRTMRALEKGTAFAAQISHTSWLMHEFTTLDLLYQAGASVPKPFGSAENAILMQYVGNDRMAAPTLHEVDLEVDEARRLFREVLRNIELMLSYDLIHGDLSAYNILYWEGEITLIDFPQVVDSVENTQAEGILRRDVARVCQYFAGQGVRSNPPAIADELWRRYTAVDPMDVVADLSRWEDDTDT